jgi:hypothetical protein
MNNQKTKPVAFYLPFGNAGIIVGESALVICTAHPEMGDMGDYEDLVRTSTVLRHEPITGEFETRNTIYKLQK